VTERQAWAKLAAGVSDGRYPSGLCAAIDRLTYGDPGLPVAVANRMDLRINALLNRRADRDSHGAWAWDLDAKGQRARAAYCRRQVARLTRKKKGKR